MKAIKHLSITFLCLILCNAMHANEIIEATSMAHFNKLKSQRKPMFVDIYAPWCGPCKAMLPILHELANEHPHITFVKVNGDTSEFRNFVKEQGVTGYPTFLLIDANGTKIDQFSGSNSKSFFGRKLEKLGGRGTVRPSEKEEMHILPVNRQMPDERVQPMYKKKVDSALPGKKFTAQLMKIDTIDQYCREVAAADKPVLIQFMIPNCVMCKHLTSLLGELQSEFPGIKFVMIDITNKRLKNVISHEGILAIPEYQWLYDRKDMTKDPKKIDIQELRKKIKKEFNV